MNITAGHLAVLLLAVVAVKSGDVGAKAKQYCQSSRKTGADGASINEFAHMVLLGAEHKGRIKYVCGGVLINEKYVVSTAHCVKSPLGEIKYIHVGDPEFKNTTGNGSPRDYTAARVIVHPEYNKKIYTNDIGLIELDSNVELSNYVQPACLQTEEAIASSGLSSAGWGLLDKSAGTPIVPKAKLYDYDEVKADECKKIFDNLQKIEITEGMVCATHESGNTCPIESGSPLQIKNAESGYTVIGISSFGAHCAIKNPLVYTRISKYIEWIESNVWVN